MSSFFTDVAGGVENVQKDYLGPTYLYHKQIKSPAEIGMSPNGDMASLSKDIGGITNYISLLVSGQSRASKTGGPLGNKFFLKRNAFFNYLKKSPISNKIQNNNFVVGGTNASLAKLNRKWTH